MPYAHSDQANTDTTTPEVRHEMGAISGDVRNRLKLEGGRPFVLRSDFSPAGDQPTAIKELVAGIVGCDRNR
jgi:excinuclease ABC subunit B